MTGMSRTGEGGEPARRFGLCVGLAAALFVALGTWANYYGVYRHDQYQLIHLGQVVHDGGTLYVDCWENKPPGVAWIIAAVLWATGGSQTATWLFPGVLGFLAILTLSWSLAAQFGRAQSMAITLMACVMFSTRSFDTPSNHPDFYAAAFALTGTSIFLVALKRLNRPWMMGAAAGVSWGLAVLCRQTGLTGPVILTLAVLAGSIRLGTAARARRRLIAAAGCACLVVVACAMSALWLRGSLREAYEAVFIFNRGLFSGAHWSHAAQTVAKLIPMNSPLVLPLTLAAIGLARVARRTPGVLDGGVVAGLALWFVVDNWLGLLGPSQIDRYWLATWTPLLFLAADGVGSIAAEFTTLPPGRRRRLCLGGGVLACGLMVPMIERQINGRYYDGVVCSATQYLSRARLLTERGTLGAIGGRVRKIVPPGESIYVLNYDPGIYIYAERSCTVRFTYPRSPAQQAEMLGVLESRPPSLILIPTDADPGPEWRLPPAQLDRLYRILGGYQELGAYLGYRFLQRRATH